MGIALAPDPALEQDDPNAPPKPKPPTATPLPTTGGGALVPPVGLAPSGAAAPVGAMTPPPMTAPMTAPVGLAPAPTVAAPSAPVDRVKLATDVFNQTAESTAPAYAAAQRDTIRNAAALGQIGSGGLRTRTGTLALERERDLDAMRKDLVTKATEGSIADANTAYQQALSGSQQNLAAELGRGQLGLQGESLGLDKEKLALDAALNKAGLTGLLDGQETLAAKQQKIQEAVTNKSLSQEDAKIALAQLAQQTSAGQTQQQIDLQKTGQEAQIAAQLKGLSLEEAKLELDKQVQTGQLSIQQANLALAAKEQAEASGARSTQVGLATEQFALAKKLGLEGLALDQANAKLDELVRTGQLTLAEKAQALNEKQQSDQQRLAEGELTGTLGPTGPLQEADWQQAAQILGYDPRTGRDQVTATQLAHSVLNKQTMGGQQLALQKEQVANQAAQFGASQTQQAELAKLADATANREIDVRTEQGQNALLLELARIMGGPSGNVDPKFIQAIAAAMGIPMTTDASGRAVLTPGGTVGTGDVTGVKTEGG